MLSFFDENSSGRQCRLAAAAVYGSRRPALLGTETDRVTVFEMVSHINPERDSDRLPVCRISRRSVADVDSLHIECPASQSFEERSVAGTNEFRTVGRHRVGAVYEPAVKHRALCPQEIVEIDKPEFGSPEKRPMTGNVTGEFGDRTAETRNDLDRKSVV